LLTVCFYWTGSLPGGLLSETERAAWKALGAGD